MTGTLFDLWPDDDPAAFEGFVDLPLRPALELDDAGRRRRSKTLATLAPLVLLEAHKGLRSLEEYDLQELALAAIELIAVGMTLEGGATTADVVQALKPALVAQHPEAGEEEHRRVASVVIETLIEAHKASYADYADKDYVRRRYEVTLVREIEGPDGIHLRASIEAINAIIGALDTDIESAQHAAEEALRYALEKGKLDAAVQAARQATLRSIQYGEQIRTLLSATRRNVAAVDWEETAPRVIADALDHLAARLETERTIIRSLAEQREEAGDENELDLAKIVTLQRLLETCIARHALLENKLLDAHKVFLDEQERQSFAPVGASYLYDVEQELLRPLLEASYGTVADLLERFFARAGGIRTPTLPRLSTLTPGLLRAPFERSELGAELVETEFAPEAELEHFPAPVWAAVDALLESVSDPTRLSELLTRARRNSEQEARLLRLRCLYAFGPELGRPDQAQSRPLLFADDDGTPLDDPVFAGADLLVFWAVRSAVPLADAVALETA